MIEILIVKNKSEEDSSQYVSLVNNISTLNIGYQEFDCIKNKFVNESQTSFSLGRERKTPRIASNNKDSKVVIVTVGKPDTKLEAHGRSRLVGLMSVSQLKEAQIQLGDVAYTYDRIFLYGSQGKYDDKFLKEHIIEYSEKVEEALIGLRNHIVNIKPYQFHGWVQMKLFFGDVLSRDDRIYQGLDPNPELVRVALGSSFPEAVMKFFYNNKAFRESFRQLVGTSYGKGLRDQLLEVKKARGQEKFKNIVKLFLQIKSLQHYSGNAKLGWFYPKRVVELLHKIRAGNESKYGKIQLDSEEKNDLASLKGKYEGKRVFILGNGPSLNKIDLDLLKDEYTFACNRIDLLYDRVNWRPNFYCVVDSRVYLSNYKRINKMDFEHAFFPKTFKGVIEKTNSVHWFSARDFSEGDFRTRFEKEITNGISFRGTVLTGAIQIARYMGFSEIVLIGTDCHYLVKDTVKQSGEDLFGSGVGFDLTSTKDDDNNHFDPKYFGKGAMWHAPNVDEMIRGFTYLSRTLELDNAKLLNATHGGQLNTIPRVSYPSLFDKKFDKDHVKGPSERL